MADNFHKPGLYKWKRLTNPRVVPSSQRVRSNNEIENWITKVEEASNVAAEVTFGTKYTSGRNRGKHTAVLATEEVRYEDEACTEAEELLNQWMNEKVLINDEIDDEYISDVWKQKAIESNVKQEWDRLLSDDIEDYPVSSRKSKRERSPDPYACLYDQDESHAVASILQNMLDKDVVKETFKKDLGFEENRPDPRVKMELRHKQVKENREKREMELERTRREKQAKRETHLQAKKIVLQEEKDKEMNSKREEQELQKEMVKIRKQFQDERRKREEEKLRIEEIKLNKEIKLETDLERQREEEGRKIIGDQKVIEERKKFVMKKMSEIQTKQVSNNMMLLHKHLTAWYEVILQRRLVLGKCRAMCDWKLLLRTWNAWRSYTRSIKLDIETQQHSQNILEHHRKNQMANRYYQTRLLQKCFTAWIIWIQQEQDKRQLEDAQNTTRQKMMTLLEKAATGQLWKGETDDKKKKLNNEINSCGSQSARQAADNQKIDDLFAQKRPNTAVQNRLLSSTSETSLCANKNTPPRVPTQAWQVTRKHLNLTTEQIASLGGGDLETNSQFSDKSIRKRFGTQPWMNTHFVVNNFEHRYTAQQKILSDQQYQLKEQRRLIEDLQYQQNQNNHQKHLEVIEVKDINGEIRERMESSDVNSAIDSTRHEQSPTHRSVCNTSRSDKTESSMATTTTNQSKTSNNSRHSQVMKNMEERASERTRLKSEREERKQRIEDERLARLTAEEGERRKEEEQEKKARIETHREKKKFEKQKEIEKQEEIERMKHLMSVADEHNRKSVIKYHGLIPMKKLVQLSHKNIQTANQHYSTVILSKVFTSWHQHAQSLTEEKNAMADQMRTFLLTKHSFSNWRKYKHHMRRIEERADTFRDRNLKSKIITVWLDYATEEKMAYWQKERRAKEHYLWYLQKKTLLAWKCLPDKIRLDREKEKRREQMRQKVASMLPDFEGVVRKSSNFL